ncbi:MAG: hypothetical protein HY074_13455, partial [Deltaproteobacteria bacterium]|nr:hypothetical protein [Deltaproteobacteria bacterium]
IRRLARPAYALDVRIVATSAGSLVSRWALNVLAASRSYSFGKHLTRFYAIDAPWHGYIGPGDHGLDAFKMFFAQPFLGDGACDVRARSDFFLGTAPADGKPAVPGLLDVVLPASFETRLVFAQQGGQALDYTEDELARLPGLWAEALSQGLSMPAEKLTRRQLNFWHALTSATAMIGLDAQGRELARQGVLSQQSALELWNRAFPRYPGDHVGVLSSPELVRDVGEWLVGTARN